MAMAPQIETHAPNGARNPQKRTLAARSCVEPAKVVRSAPFLLLTAANTLVSLAAFAVLINLVPMLVEQGLSRNTAALALGLGGVGQVIGRLGYARFAAATSVTARTVSVILAIAVDRVVALRVAAALKKRNARHG